MQNLINHNGQPKLGLIAEPVENINHQDFDYRTPLYKKAYAAQKYFHLKRFQFIGGLCDELIWGCALTDTRYLGMMFLYFFDPKTGELWEKVFRSPLARRINMCDSPTQGKSTYSDSRWDVTMAYQLTENTLTKSLRIIGPDVELTAQIDEAPSAPFRICTQTGHNGWTYAEKTAGAPLRGSLTCPLGSYDLAAIGSYGHHDFTCGYLKRETFWNWACLSVQVGDVSLGLNISRGTNETTWSENCLWINGQSVPVAGAHFVFNRDDLMAPWQVTTIDGKVALTFTPLNEHRQVLNIKVFASNFHQLFGYFTGSIVLDDKTIEIDKVWGFVEDQYAKW